VHQLFASWIMVKIHTLFVWLISHPPTVLFSQNKSAPAVSHQPNEQAAALEFELKAKFKLINTTPISAGHGSEGAYACMHVPSTATRAYYKCMETEPPRGVFFF
jgi:hypothetical protein